MNTHLLGIYLEDHLAGATGGLALARRILRENRDNAVGVAFGPLVEQLQEDLALVRQVLAALGRPPSALKTLGVLVGERLGRLKLNGRLLGYSPLSRLVELEGLLLGSMGRLGLFRMLDRLQSSEPRLQGFPFAARAERAQAHLALLEQLRTAAGEVAFLEGRALPGGRRRVGRRAPAPA